MSYFYSIVSYLYVSFSGLINSFREERANFSVIVYSLIMWFLLGGGGFLFLLVLGIGCVSLR